MKYKINKHPAYWEIEAEKTISIEDCCYDVTTDTFVIAAKHNRGLGINYSFFWNGCHWGYINVIWGDKPDKLLQYQFDKTGFYKTRKAYKLDILRHVLPFVQEDCPYLIMGIRQALSK